MRAGALRDRVRIQENTPTQNAHGEPVDSWADYVVAYAEIRPMRGREIIAASQVKSELTTEIHMRYLPGVTAAMRVLHGSIVYSIHAVLSRPERGQMTLLAAQGINDG